MIENNYENIKASAQKEVAEVQSNYDRLYANFSNIQAENTALMTTNAMLQREVESLKMSAKLASEAGFGIGGNMGGTTGGASYLSHPHFMPTFSTAPAASISVSGTRLATRTNTTASTTAAAPVPRYDPSHALSTVPTYVPLTMTTTATATVTAAAAVNSESIATSNVKTKTTIGSPSSFSFSTYEAVSDTQSRPPSTDPGTSGYPGGAADIVVPMPPPTPPTTAMAPTTSLVTAAEIPKARSRYFTGPRTRPTIPTEALATQPQTQTQTQPQPQPQQQPQLQPQPQITAAFNTSSADFLANLTARQSVAPVDAISTSVATSSAQLAELTPPLITQGGYGYDYEESASAGGQYFTLQELSEDSSLYLPLPPPASITVSMLSASAMHMRNEKLLTPGSTESESGSPINGNVDADAEEEANLSESLRERSTLSSFFD